jgi:hypothetical protein
MACPLQSVARDACRIKIIESICAASRLSNGMFNFPRTALTVLRIVLKGKLLATKMAVTAGANINVVELFLGITHNRISLVFRVTRRRRVFSIAIAITDLSIATVNYYFNSFALRLLARPVDGLCLSGQNRTGATCTFFLCCPSAGPLNYMNVSLTHFSPRGSG